MEKKNNRCINKQKSLCFVETFYQIFLSIHLYVIIDIGKRKRISKVSIHLYVIIDIGKRKEKIEKKCQKEKKKKRAFSPFYRWFINTFVFCSSSLMLNFILFLLFSCICFIFSLLPFVFLLLFLICFMVCLFDWFYVLEYPTLHNIHIERKNKNMFEEPHTRTDANIHT